MLIETVTTRNFSNYFSKHERRNGDNVQITSSNYKPNETVAHHLQLSPKYVERHQINELSQLMEQHQNPSGFNGSSLKSGSAPSIFYVNKPSTPISTYTSSSLNTHILRIEDTSSYV